MKILLATDTYRPSVNGAAYFTARLAQGLAKRGHTVFVVCPAQSFKNTVTTDGAVTIYGIRSLPVPVYQNLRISPVFMARGPLQEVLHDVAPDVVHIQSHFFIGKAAARISKQQGIPVVGTNHFMPENISHYFHLPATLEQWLERWGWRQCVAVFAQLDGVTTPTKTAAKLLRQAGLTHTIVPISCGIDLARFTPKNDGAYLHQRYAVPSDGPIILHVGRLDKEKHIEVILRALVVMRRRVAAHLVLAGIGEERPRLERLVGDLDLAGAVTFTGFVPDDDLPNLYRIADLFVTASVAELQSIATMEALASGLPVVAAKAVALPELVHDGENGYLFPKGDSQVLADRAVAILDNEERRTAMAKKSLEIISAHDIHTTLIAYETLYAHVCHH